MYFWACWFNRRYRLIAYLALTLVLVVLAALPAGFERYQGHWAVVRITSPEHLAWVWNTGIGNTMAAMLVALVFIAADLGALGLGDDPERGNLDFLLSRPRFRAQLVWSGWFAGLTQLLPLLVLPLLTCLGVLAALTHTLRPGNLLRLSVPLFAMAAAVHSGLLHGDRRSERPPWLRTGSIGCSSFSGVQTHPERGGGCVLAVEH